MGCPITHTAENSSRKYEIVAFETLKGSLYKVAQNENEEYMHAVVNAYVHVQLIACTRATDRMHVLSVSMCEISSKTATLISMTHHDAYQRQF